MVVGHVQSGKTANYTGLICKAADAGYQLVVIAGVHNNLRNQTQIRIDEGFVGRDSARMLSNGQDKIIGVGQFDSSKEPVTFTNSKRDFNKAVATSVGVGLHGLKNPAVFVIKKNSSTLKNLLEWLREHSRRGNRSTIDAPMLVAAWRGPLGAPKDFEIGRVCVEAKARRGAAEPHVMISSEHQLDLSGTDALFLHVVELAAATDQSDDGFSVSDIANRLHQQIAGVDASAADHFDSLLVANGLNREDHYSDSRWIRGPDRLYRVGEGFPSVTSGQFPSGVSGVRYSVSLPDCEAWRVSNDEFRAALKGAGDGN